MRRNDGLYGFEFVVGSPRTHISVVLGVACLNTCRWLLSPDDGTERGPRRWMSIMLMGSNPHGKRHRTMQNAVMPDAPRSPTHHYEFCP